MLKISNVEKYYGKRTRFSSKIEPIVKDVSLIVLKVNLSLLSVRVVVVSLR